MTFQYITNEQLNGFDSYKYSCKGIPRTVSYWIRLTKTSIRALELCFRPVSDIGDGIGNFHTDVTGTINSCWNSFVLTLLLIGIFRYITTIKLGDASFLECNSQVISSLGGAKLINVIRIFILSITNYSVMGNRSRLQKGRRDKWNSQMGKCKISPAEKFTTV